MSAVIGNESAEALTAAIEVTSKIRGAKSDAQRSLRWPVAELKVVGSKEHVDALRRVLDDVRAAGNVAGEIVIEAGPAPEGERFGVEVTLGEEAQDSQG